MPVCGGVRDMKRERESERERETETGTETDTERERVKVGSTAPLRVAAHCKACLFYQSP